MIKLIKNHPEVIFFILCVIALTIDVVLIVLDMAGVISLISKRFGAMDGNDIVCMVWIFAGISIIFTGPEVMNILNEDGKNDNQ